MSEAASQSGAKVIDPASAGTRLDRVTGIVARIAEGICVAMFAVVFTVFIVKIALRYLAGDAAAWADEVAVVLFIWIIFLANGFVVEDRRQITFDLIHRHLPPRSQRVVEIARILVIGGLLAAALPAVLDYTLFLWRERTPVLRWRLDMIYSCFALFMIAMLVRMAARLVQLVRPVAQVQKP